MATISSVSTDPTAAYARQQADAKQLTAQEIKKLAPQIGDTVIGTDGKEIELTKKNYDAFMNAHKNGKDFFVSKADGTIYFQDKNGIDILADAGNYTDNTDDDLATIKYSTAAHDAFNTAMLGDASKKQQTAAVSMAKYFEDNLGPVPTDAEAAKVLAKVLPPGYYTRENLQETYDALKAKKDTSDEGKSLLSVLGKVLYDHDTFNKIDGIRTNGATDGSISTWGLAIVGNETI